MAYRSPVADILFSLKHVAGLDEAIESGMFGDLDAETVASVISEAGRFATEVIAPLNRVGDQVGATYQNGAVATPPGFRDAYRQWAAAGWAGVTASPDYGGMGLPHSVNFACAEIWNGASMGFALCPLLSEGGDRRTLRLWRRGAARDLSEPAGQRRVDGHDEPHRAAGRLGPRRREDPRRARRRRDLSPFRPEDLHHLRRARHGRQHRPSRAGAAARRAARERAACRCSSRRSSSSMPTARSGARNDVRCACIEHKLGIHASPTCVMIYGDAGGATGWLVGEENRGLAAMFVMMNSARLAVGLQGVAIGERALSAGARLRARAPAGAQRQGRRRHEPDRRAPGRPAHADDDEGARPGGARRLPPDGGRDRPLVARAERRGSARRRASAPRC